MGNCISSSARAYSVTVSEAIDKLKQEAKNRTLKREAKILLLGAGESGKSTIVKQMKIIHHNGFSDQERELYVPIIRRNLLDSLKVVLDILDTADITPESVPEELIWETGKWFVERALTTSYLRRMTDHVSASSVSRCNTPTHSEEFHPPEEGDAEQVGQAIEKIWADSVVQKLVETMCSTYTTQSDYQLMDNASFFLSTATRILPAGYLPEAQDILHSRAKSTGIKESRFTMDHLSMHLFDVGGQRSERRKWIHCFEGVTSIIFCTALSEYDQVLEEDRRQNRMQESLELFKSIIQSQWFLRTSIILFLNKLDVFKRKLSKVPLKMIFPEYDGGDDNEGIRFILQRYEQTFRKYSTYRILYPHVTQATDTSAIHKVFIAVEGTINRNALYDSGLL